MPDFDHCADRSGTDSLKWSKLPEFCPGTENALPFWIADMEFAVPEAITRALKERIAKPVYSYTLVPDSFYDAVIGWYARRHGLRLQKEEILPSSGVLYTLACILDCFTGKEDAVILNVPAYNCFLKMLEGLGHPIAKAPLRQNDTGWQLDLAAVEAQMQAGARAYVLCTPHNPAGRVWSRAELEAVVALCEKYDVLLIADEIHSDLVLPGNTHTPILRAAEGSSARIFMINSPSKTFNIPAMNAAYAVCRNRELLRTLAAYMEAHENSINFLGRIALEAGYTEGEEWLAELLPVLLRNAETVKEYLTKYLPLARCCIPEATYLMWLDFSAYGFSQEALMKALGEAGVAASNGLEFGAPREGFIRFNIGCPADMLKEGLSRVRKAVTGLMSRNVKSGAPFNPEINMPVCVYGPPGWFRNRGEIPTVENNDTRRV